MRKRPSIDKTKLVVHTFEGGHNVFILDMSHLKTDKARAAFITRVEKKYPDCICGCLEKK